MKKPEKSSHVQQAVARAIPDELTVTKAAELLGVGRPTLSVLLNGRSELSDDMIVRLHLVFGVPVAKLARVRYLDQLARVEAMAWKKSCEWGRLLPYKWNKRRVKEKTA